MTDHAVTTDAATVRFGRRTVLGPVDLAIDRGTTVAVLGHNGAGKTTLLRLIAGSVTPASGSVRVVGRDPVTQWREVASVVGSSFYPERAFYFRLTVAENLRYFQALQGVLGRAARREREVLLAETGLTEQADQRFMELSLGQRKRLGLAKSAIGNPSVVLLDEPLANLDEDGRTTVAGVIERWATRGVTTVFTTHQIADVRSLVTDLVTVTAGRVAHQAVGVGADDTVPTREVVVRGGPRPGCDLSSVSARFATDVDGDRISLAVPVDVELSDIVARLESAGVGIESIHDDVTVAAQGASR